MQGRGGHDVRPPGAFDTHARAQMGAEIACAAGGAEAAELGQLQRHRVERALVVRIKQRVGVMGKLVELHRQTCSVAHARAGVYGGAGLFQHHVEMGHGAGHAGGCERIGPAIPVAIDKRPFAHGLAHLVQPFHIGLPVIICAKLGLKLADPLCLRLARDARHLIRCDAGDGVIKRQRRLPLPA